MAGEAPERRGNSKLLLKLARPQHLSAGCVQAEQVPFCAQCIDLASSDDRRRARTRWITHVVGAVIFMLPKQLAVGLIEAEHPLSPGDHTAMKWIARIRTFRSQLPVGQEDSSLRDGWPGVTRADRHSPAEFQSIGWEFFEDA